MAQFSHVVTKSAWMADVRHGGSVSWFDEFESCTLGIASCSLWVVSLHEFGDFLGEVSRWEMFCVLGVEPFVPC